MADLNSNRGILPLHESDQRLEAFGLGLVPDTEIVLIDEADILDRGDLDKDESEAAERIAAQMHQMEVAAGVAGLGAVMDHWRHDEAVFQLKAADLDRLEQHRLRGPPTLCLALPPLRFFFPESGG